MAKLAKTFSELCLSRMAEKGLGVVELANLLGAHHSNVSAYVHGKKEPGLKTIAKYGEILNFTIEDVTSGIFKDTPAPTPGIEADKLLLIGMILDADHAQISTFLRILKPYIRVKDNKSSLSG